MAVMSKYTLENDPEVLRVLYDSIVPWGNKVPTVSLEGLRFQADWADPRGLLAADPRVRTLTRVLVTYPDVRHIVPDRISLEASTDPKTIETVVRFLERQQWLVKAVDVE